MSRLTALLLLLSLLFSCRSVKEVPMKTEVKVVERLVPVQLPADSATLVALLECDSTNQVVLKQLLEEKSRQVETRVEYLQGELRYRVLRLPDTLYLPAKDSIVYQDKVVTVQVEKPYIPSWMVWLTAAAALLVAIKLYTLLKR